jgi:hypothetical protein
VRIACDEPDVVVCNACRVRGLRPGASGARVAARVAAGAGSASAAGCCVCRPVPAVRGGAAR